MFPQVLELVQSAFAGASTVQRWLAFWGPVAVSGSALLGPFLALSSVLTLALLTGVAAGALATLIVALLAIYLLLTEVFGVSIDAAV